jgi:hypothetical protein
MPRNANVVLSAFERNGVYDVELLVKTRTMLWGRAGGHCSFPECRRNLIFDASETDDESLVGDIAHIVAESQDGPRGDSPITPEERRKFSNLILLCKVHHKLVDDQPNKFTVESLLKMKAEHELWVRSALGFDMANQRDNELYADMIDVWSRAASIETWQSWTSMTLCGDRPQFLVEQYNALRGIRLYLLGRIWPRRYPNLEGALENFGDVCSDMCNVFGKHSKRYGDTIETEKFYKAESFPQDVYRRLLREYEFHVELIEDLLAELTRAANYICDKVRESFDPAYRLKEGVLLITRGPFFDLSVMHMRLEYREGERTIHPYPGLERFLVERQSRDRCFGRGVKPNEDEE